MFTRRDVFKKAGMGFGMLALGNMLQADDSYQNPLAPKRSHFPAKAKRVIWIFINGGPSHVDTWDYKPALEKWDGKSLTEFDPKFNKFTGFFSNAVGNIMKSPFEFKQHGECGKHVSSIFPHLSKHVDKMAFIHSGYTKSNNHAPALFAMQSGHILNGYPCVGAWATYGLGSEANDLPSFVVMSDPKGRGLPKGHSLNWSAGFLPSVYQGTWLKPKGNPIENLDRHKHMTAGAQRSQLDFLKSMNQNNLEKAEFSSELAARIESFELAHKMQTAAPEALDLNNEPQHIRDLYGVGNKDCDHFAKQCLTARRMVERGTRFVQIYSGGMENQRSWDGHNDIKGNHEGFAKETDQPIAALLEDLSQRGMLDGTLVIWGGEFGRLPIAQTGKKPGRDHNPNAFTSWMAGGGIKGGVSYGETDELGYKAVENRVHVNDFHATILHLLGMDHKKLTYNYNGRRFRLTDVGGNVLHKIIS